MAFITLSDAFRRMTTAESFALADACGQASEALDNGQSALCGQFIASAYVAVAASGGVEGVEATLGHWHMAYAASKGATVSDKGRISTDGMTEAGKASYIKVRNSFNVAKSAIVKAVRLTDKILPLITDGGSVLLDGNGMPRSKGALLAFIADASKVTKTDLEKAVSRAMAAFAAARKLNDTDRAIFDDTIQALVAGTLSAGDADADDAE